MSNGDGYVSTFAGVRDDAAALLRALGVPAAEADVTAMAITLAERWGLASHGLMRLPFYLARLRSGGVRPDAELHVVRDSGPVVACDGQGGLGHWQAWQAAQMAAERCSRYGLAAVSVGNSSHCGALGVYALPIVEAGYLGLVFSNGPAVMPPWGGSAPILSTSPIAAGIPCRPQPAIIDMATSAVARGRIAERAQRGEQLPAGWALDAAGSPTIDPQAALRGMLAPLGGAKGYALALLVEALTGGMVGPALSSGVADMFDAGAEAVPQRISHLMVAVDPAQLDVDGAGQRRLDELAALVVASGGRLPGGRRRPPGEIPPSEPLTVSPTTAAQLAQWRDLLRTTGQLVPDGREIALSGMRPAASTRLRRSSVALALAFQAAHRSCARAPDVRAGGGPGGRRVVGRQSGVDALVITPGDLDAALDQQRCLHAGQHHAMQDTGGLPQEAVAGRDRDRDVERGVELPQFLVVDFDGVARRVQDVECGAHRAKLVRPAVLGRPRGSRDLEHLPHRVELIE